ncbi:unnamed protein product [Paramecium pentaurelia]|uniref:Protein disulfide-isomerase n=1 Tax=Paramecium pentaurelia TaxID=43138 RepID=A0A8S1VN41_9CILI|nr:unnamed protein product [Paramecium pentaurelia]
MKSLIFISLLLATSLGAFQEEDNVLVLTTDTFQDAIDTFKFILVEFYAPWCGHCKKLAPEYSAAAAELKKQGGDNYVPLAKVDATAESSVAEKFSIQGYPTLKFFINGQPIDYEGGRTQADIVAWINKKSGPPSNELNSVQDLEKFLERVSSSPIIVFFGSQEDDNDFQTFKAVAQQNDKVTFAHIFNAEASEKYSVQGKIVLFKSFDEKRNDFDGSITNASLEQFINAHGNPVLLPFNDKAINIIFQQRNNAVLLFTDDSDAGVAAYEVFASVAGAFKDRIKFSFSKPNDGSGLFHRLAEYVGASTVNVPNIMIYDQQGGNAKYRFEESITVDSLRNFLTNFFDNKLDRYMKSEEIPSSNDEPVKIIVGKNFKDLVINNDKDVLVEFYAPWCGHCKQLAPVYEALAKKLQVNPNIIIAKCDATANEVEGVSIESFPTLKFWKNGQKDQVISYSGGRDEAGFISFLKENTSHPWVDLDRVEEL